MKESTLDRKIHRFMARKERQYPELTKPINTLTRDLETDQIASPLHQYARDVYVHDAKTYGHNRRFPDMRYAM